MSEVVFPPVPGLDEAREEVARLAAEAADPASDPLRALRAAEDLAAAARRLAGLCAAQARGARAEAGRVVAGAVVARHERDHTGTAYSWSEIGRAVGVTAQGAQRRYAAAVRAAAVPEGVSPGQTRPEI